MLKLRSNGHGLGQPTRVVDPTIYLALRTAGEVLRYGGDPGAPETAELIRRNIEAPGFPNFGFSPQKDLSRGRVSDLNPTLKTVAVIRENPYPVMAGAVLLPVFFYMLGRASRR